ncbi:MAG: 30S ribosome-binding factor RbfA [Luteibaculaceae bacterium]
MSIRQERVSNLIKQELAVIFQRLSPEHFPGKFITVTVVRISPDLSFCKVYLSLLGEKDPEATVNLVNIKKGLIRGQLGNEVGKQLRKVPELAFFHDDSLAFAENIENLLK